MNIDIPTAVLEEEITAIFDDQAQNWSQDLDINMLFLRGVENYMNDCLKVRGHVFLNEVYDELGLPRTSQGALVGWVLSSGKGIDFGVQTPDEKGGIPLKFNVDGVIYNQIEEDRA